MLTSLSAPAVPVQEAKYFVQKSRAVLVLVAQSCKKLGKELAQEISSSTKLNFQSIDITPYLFNPLLSSSDLIISSDHTLDPLGSGLVIFTSGTTGPPKAAVKRRSFLDGNAQAVADLYRILPGDIVMHTLPVHHATGIGTTFFPYLISGAAIEFHSNGFNPAIVWERWKKGGLSFFSGVPTMYMRLMAYFEGTISKLSHGQVQEYVTAAGGFKALLCGTSALPRPLQQKWSALLGGRRILERYGTTEFSGAFTVHPNDKACPDVSIDSTSYWNRY
jgi:malonyl-CoA/methylmalonyl-CoA synthetase